MGNCGSRAVVFGAVSPHNCRGSFARVPRCASTGHFRLRKSFSVSTGTDPVVGMELNSGQGERNISVSKIIKSSGYLGSKISSQPTHFTRSISDCLYVHVSIV